MDGVDGVERVEVERMGLKKTTKKERGQRNKGRGGEGEKNWELPLPFFKCYMGAGKGRKGRRREREEGAKRMKEIRFDFSMEGRGLEREQEAK